MSETKLVLELQRDALNSKTSISDLLRKALVVATKLGVNEFQGWVSAELNGYKDVEIPPYREVQGRVRQWNPYHGWLPAHSEDAETERRLTHRQCAQSAPEMEAMLARSTPKTEFHMPFSPDVAIRLMQSLGGAGDITLVVSGSEIDGILQSVRNVILNWTLRLEKEGILGEGLSFSREERDAAARVSQSVTNYFGPVGTVQVQHGHDQMQVALSGSVDVKAIGDVLAKVEAVLGQLDLSRDAASEVEAEVATARAQLSSPRPKRAILKSSLDTVHRVLEATAGNMAGTLLAELVKILAQLS
jgi:hypothetical protein